MSKIRFTEDEVLVVHKALRFIFWSGLLCIGLGGGAVAGMYYNTLETLPDVEDLKQVTFETPMQVFTQDGKLIGEFGEHKRFPVSLDEIPLKMQQAFLAIEDSRFYEHTGIDPIGILRAVVVAISNQSASQGASTITQQVARNFFLTREKSLERKIKEVFISWRIEQVLTKDEILTLYLNKIALGHRSYGVAAAAQVYYGKTLDELTLAEMATIAGLPKAPSTLNPISNPKRSKERRHLVLNRMLTLGYITKEEFDEADIAPAATYYHATPVEAYAPYVAEEVRKAVVDNYGEKAYTDGIKVITTVKAKTQDDASYAVFKGITDYDSRHGFRGVKLNLHDIKCFEYSKESLDRLLIQQDRFHYITPAIVTKVDDKKKVTYIYLREEGEQVLDFEAISWAREFKGDSNQGPAIKVPSEVLKSGDLIYTYVNNEGKRMMTQLPEVEAALIAINPFTGAIEAMAGGYDFDKSKLNRTTQAVRQTGSNLKPFLYSAALAKGIAINSVLQDMPIKTWDPGSQTWWEPKNTPNRYEGPMTLREALAKSKNVVTIRLMRLVGVEPYVEHLKKFGIEVPKSQQSESMALGSVEVTPIQLATGYATFANGGYKLEPYLIDKIYKGDELIFEAEHKVADPYAKNRVINNIKLVYDESVPEDDRLYPQVLSHAHAYIMADMLRTVIYGGEGINGKFYGTSGRAYRYTNRMDLHGKTGTTNDVHDAWFSGFNQNIVATAWMGFDNSRNLGYSRTKGPEGGAYSALPIFTEFIKRAQNGVPENPIIKPDEGVYYATNAGITDLVTTGSNATNEAEVIVKSKDEEVENTGTDTSNVDESDIF